MKIFEADYYRSLKQDTHKIQNILTKGDNVRSEVKVTYIIGYKMLRIMNTSKVNQYRTIQSIARSLHNVLAISSLFPDTKEISRYDTKNDNLYTNHLVSSKDIRSYLYQENVVESSEQYLNDYFSKTSKIRYEPKRFYICNSTRNYQLEFKNPRIEDLINCYHDIVERIEQNPVQAQKQKFQIMSSDWYDEFEGDLNVIGMVVKHHKADLYRISPNDMQSLYEIGKNMNYLIIHNHTRNLDSLDRIANGLTKLAKKRAINPYQISDILDKSDVAQEKQTMLKNYGIERLNDSPDCINFFAGIHNINQKYVQCSNGYLSALSIQTLVKIYCSIIERTLI